MAHERRNRTIGVVDLFCGIGGLTCGLKKAGLDVVAGIDLDDKCRYTYECNNKVRFINKNISEVKGKEIKSLLSGYDIKVLAGCAPCQPFSNHQKDKKNRKLHKDWNLLYQFSRLIKEVNPHVVSMENVPELEKEDVFKDFVRSLKDCGYNVNYGVYDASLYGVPQRRHRLLLIASRKKSISIIGPTHKEPITVKEAIGMLPPIGAGVENRNDSIHIASALSEINTKRIQCSIPGGTWKDWPEELILPCHKRKSGRTYPSVYGRMKWDDVAPTITTQFTAYGTGRFGHPEQDRALTLREGAVLQTFPQDYEFCEPNQPVVIKKIARHIGNAVPPRLGEIIGISIKEQLGVE